MTPFSDQAPSREHGLNQIRSGLPDANLERIQELGHALWDLQRKSLAKNTLWRIQNSIFAWDRRIPLL